MAKAIDLHSTYRGFESLLAYHSMSLIDTYFDKIFYLSLEKDGERRVNLLQQFEKYDVTNIEWVKGSKINNLPNFDLYRNFIKNDSKYVIGQLGCRSAHLSAVKLAYERNYERVLIFEDDIQFLADPSEILRQNIDHIANWNMLYFGGLVEPMFRNQIVCAHAYAINRAVMSDILCMAEASGMEIDNFYAKIIQHMSFNYNRTGKYNIQLLHPFNLIIQNKHFVSNIQT